MNYRPPAAEAIAVFDSDAAPPAATFSILAFALSAVALLGGPRAGAQVTNDDCGPDVPLLTVTTAGDDFAAVLTTEATIGPATGCSETWINDDVWFRFVAAAPSLGYAYRGLAATRGEVSGVGFAVYDACDGREIACLGRFGAGETAASYEGGLSEALVAGETYYLRTWTGGADNAGAYELALRGVTPGVDNDFCGAGVPELPNTTASGPVYADVTTAGATMGPLATCSQTWIDDDVWFSFVAEGGDVRVHYRELAAAAGTVEGIGYAIYEDCGGEELACVARFGAGETAASDRPVLRERLRVGERYYLRVWSGGADNAAVFRLAVETLDVVVANDDCAGATPIAFRFDRDSTEYFEVNTVGATRSTVGATCAGDDRDDDVWFDFEAISVNLVVSYVRFRPSDPAARGIGYALYDGCNGAEIACGRVLAQTDGTGIEFANPLPRLTVGQRYRLSMYVLGPGGGAFDAKVRGVRQPEIAEVPPAGTCVTSTATVDGSGGIVRFLDPEGRAIMQMLNTVNLGEVTVEFSGNREAASRTFGPDDAPLADRNVTIRSERSLTGRLRMATYATFEEVRRFHEAGGSTSFLDYVFARRDATDCGTAFEGADEEYPTNAILDYPGGYYIDTRVTALGDFYRTPANTLVGTDHSAPAAPSPLRVYPNPASATEVITVEWRDAVGAPGVATLTDATGRILLRQRLGATPWTLPTLPAGAYWLRVTDEDVTSSVRLLIQ